MLPRSMINDLVTVYGCEFNSTDVDELTTCDCIAKLNSYGLEVSSDMIVDKNNKSKIIIDVTNSVSDLIVNASKLSVKLRVLNIECGVDYINCVHIRNNVNRIVIYLK